MTASPRIARALSAAILGFGLLAVAAPAAQADKADKAERAPADEHTFDCDGSSSSEQAWKTSDQTDGDHPSGQVDKGLVESGNSGTQGKSDSNPDGDSNRPAGATDGADKPGCTGGFDDHDRDGNNGCGNDHDFEDDNNGNCGGKAEDEAADTDSPDVQAQAAGAVTPVAVAPAPATVAGAVEVAGTDTTGTTTTPETQVLGITETQPDTLARTGAGLGALVLAAGACLGGGRLTCVVRRLLGS
ncbi:MAG: hypothetical protein ACRD0O_21700 [Acidimicrobiia bacterium]